MSGVNSSPYSRISFLMIFSLAPEKEMIPTSLFRLRTSSRTSMVFVSWMENTYFSGSLLRITSENARMAIL